MKGVVDRLSIHAHAHHPSPITRHGHTSHRAAPLKELCTRFIIKHFDRVTKADAFASLSRELILEVLQSR